jgi:hypothetical protein
MIELDVDAMRLDEINAKIDGLNKFIIYLDTFHSKDSERLSIGAKLDLIELAANRDELLGKKQMAEMEEAA